MGVGKHDKKMPVLFPCGLESIPVRLGQEKSSNQWMLKWVNVYITGEGRIAWQRQWDKGNQIRSKGPDERPLGRSEKPG